MNDLVLLKASAWCPSYGTAWCASSCALGKWERGVRVEWDE